MHFVLPFYALVYSSPQNLRTFFIKRHTAGYVLSGGCEAHGLDSDPCLSIVNVFLHTRGRPALTLTIEPIQFFGAPADMARPTRGCRS